jgi:dihydrolipoamide dehydrogenase
MTFDYDIIIIGAGPGGYTAAIRAAQLGMKTALAEKNRLGGVCLHQGCIPTKSLLDSAARLQAVRSIAFPGLTADFSKIMIRKNETVSKIEAGIAYLMEKNGVTVLQGSASFLDEHTLSVDGKAVTAGKFIVASGSSPKIPSALANKRMIIDSSQLLNIKELPESMIIVGGGVIGVEFAGLFNTLGSKVTVLEYCDSILPAMDKGVAAALRRILKKRGINIVTGALITGAEAAPARQTEVKFTVGEKQQTARAEIVLCAVGRGADFSELRLKNAGVEAVSAIETDSLLLTKQKHIAAVGDVTGGLQLAHVASFQGIAAAEVLSGQRKQVDMGHVPTCLYGEPELSSVGLSEEEAACRELDFYTAVFPMAACGKAVILGESEGFIKLIAAKGSNKLLGLHILAPRASDMIMEGVLALNKGMSLHDIANSIHPHPTVCEAVAEVARLALGQPVNI